MLFTTGAKPTNDTTVCEFMGERQQDWLGSTLRGNEPV